MFPLFAYFRVWRLKRKHERLKFSLRELKQSRREMRDVAEAAGLNIARVLRSLDKDIARLMARERAVAKELAIIEMHLIWENSLYTR